MTPNHIVYLELPARDIAQCKRFYSSAFGWRFEDFGPSYTAFSQSGLDGGFNADANERTRRPLPVIATRDIEAMEQKVVSAGGRIIMPTFAFPGGRRFHFVDPEGNELAVMQPDTAPSQG
jgi:predicted enzyme related to lactoylglutathione lyase